MSRNPDNPEKFWTWWLLGTNVLTNYGWVVESYTGSVHENGTIMGKSLMVGMVEIMQKLLC